MRPAQRDADARRDFIARDHRFEEGEPAGPAGFRHGQGGGDGRAARVVDGRRENIIELDRVRGGGVDQGDRPGGASPAA